MEITHRTMGSKLEGTYNACITRVMGFHPSLFDDGNIRVQHGIPKHEPIGKGGAFFEIFRFGFPSLNFRGVKSS